MAFPCRLDRAHDALSFAYSNGSAKKVDVSSKDSRGGAEVAGTIAGTGLFLAHPQEVIRLVQCGKTATNTSNRAELVGVQAWLKRTSEEKGPPDSTFKLIIDSQVTVQAIEKKNHQITHFNLVKFP